MITDDLYIYTNIKWVLEADSKLDHVTMLDQIRITWYIIRNHKMITMNELPLMTSFVPQFCSSRSARTCSFRFCDFPPGHRDPLNNMELRRPADRKLIPNNQLRSQIRCLLWNTVPNSWRPFCFINPLIPFIPFIQWLMASLRRAILDLEHLRTVPAFTCCCQFQSRNHSALIIWNRWNFQTEECERVLSFEHVHSFARLVGFRKCVSTHNVAEEKQKSLECSFGCQHIWPTLSAVRGPVRAQGKIVISS